jgi:hypothetical protein
MDCGGHFGVGMQPSPAISAGGGAGGYTSEELRRLQLMAESTRSLSVLEYVHERQTRRMQTRSEWFLTAGEHHDDGASPKQQHVRTGSITLDDTSASSVQYRPTTASRAPCASTVDEGDEAQTVSEPLPDTDPALTQRDSFKKAG